MEFKGLRQQLEDYEHQDNMRKFLDALNLYPTRELDDLMAALSAGGSNFTPGGVLASPIQIESLEKVLKSVTFDEKNLKP